MYSPGSGNMDESATAKGIMNDNITNIPSASFAVAALFAIVSASIPLQGKAESPPAHSPASTVLAQAAAPTSPPPPAVSAPAPAPSTIATWTFAAAPGGSGDTWVAERGRLTFVDGEARLQPDANRRVTLLSPLGLPEATRAAEAFAVGISGTGLQRIRIQARRDARGGWITIADAGGDALRETTDGYVVKRKGGSRTEPIERLRIELDFRTSNPRTLQRIAVH